MNMDATTGDQRLSDPVEEPLIPLPKTMEGLTVLQSNMGMKSVHVAKALLDSIVLSIDLDEYMGVSEQTLANCYDCIQCEVNLAITLH